MEFYESQKRKEVNALSVTDALGWTSLMNGLTGAKATKANFQDILPYQDHSVSDGELMPSARNTLIKLIRKGRLPKWAEGLAMTHTSVSRAINGD